MKYWSETLNRTFDTVEALESAESLHEARQAEAREKAEAERLRKAELAEQRSKRAQEVKDAYTHADKLIAQYWKDYYPERSDFNSLFDLLFNI